MVKRVNTFVLYVQSLAHMFTLEYKSMVVRFNTAKLAGRITVRLKRFLYVCTQRTTVSISFQFQVFDEGISVLKVVSYYAESTIR